MKILLRVVGMVLLMGATGVICEGQMAGIASQPAQLNPPVPPSTRGRPNLEEAISPETLDRQEQARNLERQRRLVADTDKLLLLATDLKSQVTKANNNPLQPDEARKAEEIEKLAKSVRDHMRS